MKTYYFDVDGVLANFHDAYAKLDNRGYSVTYDFIRNLEPFAENIALVKRLIAEGNRVYISTMVANESTKKARIEWLNEMLPEIPNYRIITITDHSKKCNKMRTKTGILVDDKKANCNQWIKAGHEAIYLEIKGGVITL